MFYYGTLSDPHHYEIYRNMDAYQDFFRTGQKEKVLWWTIDNFLTMVKIGSSNHAHINLD